MAENIIDVSINLIKTEGRFRKDFGDIPALANSIKTIGLLQPIGIDSGYRLVFGERRLRAFQHLGRENIPARFVNLESLLSGEYAENEFRKDFTASERVEIGKALEVELQGRRNATLKQNTVPENLPEREIPKGDTRDIAAKAAGFGNGRTYEQAKAVVAKAAPELVAAMDEGKVSVSAAATLAELPKAEQVELVKKEPKQIQQAAKKVRESKLTPVKPIATPTVLMVINCMDNLLRQAQSEGVPLAELCDRFIDEIDPDNAVIADRLKATRPVMDAISQISQALAD
jgi:ParB-like chromosome segregation protein Spo0J